jgi:hypothetical protein
VGAVPIMTSRYAEHWWVSGVVYGVSFK